MNRSSPADKLQSFHGIYTVAPQMFELFERMRRVARSRANVLVRGETGAGKELVAAAIHAASPREVRALPFAELVDTLKWLQEAADAKDESTGYAPPLAAVDVAVADPPPSSADEADSDFNERSAAPAEPHVPAGVAAADDACEATPPTSSELDAQSDIQSDIQSNIHSDIQSAPEVRTPG